MVGRGEVGPIAGGRSNREGTQRGLESRFEWREDRRQRKVVREGQRREKEKKRRSGSLTSSLEALGAGG